jgi:hypothetical protein
VRAEATALANETKRQLAVTALALARHHLAVGSYPDRLEDLVPRFLAAVPMDPVDGRALRYRREDPQFPRLYSVGLNGKDDGGWGKAQGAPDEVWERPEE